MEQRVRIGVYGAAVDPDRLLLTQLWSNDPDPGKWTLPGGGMEFGETPQETLEREFYEETGLTPRIGGVIDVISYVSRSQIHVVQMIYEVEAEGEPRVIEVEGSTVDARWIPTASIGSLPTVPLVDHLMMIRGFC
jgi:ADP-ribose pyrophosphatase YjhB (NUDIX family)